MWAVGVVLYTLLYGQYPFGPGNSTREQMIYDIKHSQPRYPEGVASISPELRDFLDKVFNRSQDKDYGGGSVESQMADNITQIHASCKRAFSVETFSGLRDGRRRASTNPEDLESQKENQRKI